MRHQHNLFAQVLAGQCVKGIGHALAQLHQGLSPLGCKVGVPLAPATGLVRPVVGDLGVGQAFKNAKAAFAQALVQTDLACLQHRRFGGNRQRGGFGAQQVTGVNGVDGLIRQGIRHTLGLPAPMRVEVDVELPLDARVYIPGGLAVAYGDDAGGVAHSDTTCKPESVAADSSSVSKALSPFSSGTPVAWMPLKS